MTYVVVAGKPEQESNFSVYFPAMDKKVFVEIFNLVYRPE